MAHYSAKPICIKLRASKQLAICLLLMTCLASLATWVLAWVWALPLSAGIWFGAMYAIRLHALKQSAYSVIQIDIKRQGEVSVLYRNGRQQAVNLSGQSVVSPYIVVVLLQVKTTHRWHSVIIMPDAADTEFLRQLRVWLRWAWSSESPSI